MKRFIFTAFAIAVAGLSAIAQDRPSFVSKGGNTKWFYLRNVECGRYLLSGGADVFTMPKAYFPDFEKVARQLWCFTTEDGVWYTITNKYDGKQMDNGLSAKFSNWESVQMKENAAAKFRIHIIGGDTVRFEADRPAPGGGEIFRFPAVYLNEESSYLLWMVRESNGQGTASQFVVEPYTEAQEPEMQNSENVTYYNIESGKEGTGGENVYDNTSVVDTKYRFVIGKTEQDNRAAQWRLVALRPGRVAIVNRATGNSISTDIDVEGQYNLPEADAMNVAAKPWNILAAGSGEFLISSTGNDKITRYLNNTTLGEAPEELDVANVSGSGFAWKFNKADEAVGIDNLRDNTPYVKVENGRVAVADGTPFTLTTTDGVRLPSSTVLHRGIYIVNVAGKTVKINVR